MSNLQFEKLFDVEEANQLIPALELLLGELQTKANRLRGSLSEMAMAHGSEDFDFQAAINASPELTSLAEDMAILGEQIEDYGCFLKDIDLGLVDFPAEIDNHVVFLCWQFGEHHIAAWHEIDGGFASRKPIYGAPKPYLN